MFDQSYLTPDRKVAVRRNLMRLLLLFLFSEAFLKNFLFEKKSIHGKLSNEALTCEIEVVILASIKLEKRFRILERFPASSASKISVARENVDFNIFQYFRYKWYSKWGTMLKKLSTYVKKNYASTSRKIVTTSSFRTLWHVIKSLQGCRGKTAGKVLFRQKKMPIKASENE